MPRSARQSGSRGLALAVTVAVLLAGCVVGPNYVRPPVLPPAAYKEMAGWKLAQPRDDTIRGAWWEIFGERDLSALEAQVSLSNQNLAQAEATYRQARALVREARSAYFPTATIGAGYTRASASSTVQTSSGKASAVSGSSAASVAQGTAVNSQSRSSDFFQLPLDVSWMPDLWGRIRRSVESSQSSAQASAGDLENARLSFQAEVAQDYFQLRTLDAQRQLLDATAAAYTNYLELTRNRYTGGVASRADVAQAETQLKTTQAQAIDVGVLRAQTEHAIALLVGQAPSTFSLSPAPLAGSPPAIPIGVPSELLERRPDIAAAERRVAAANAQIGVAIAAFYPSVTLSLSTGFQSSGLATWLTAPSRFWAVGPSISQTVLDGGLRRAQTDAARAAYDGSVAAYRQTVLVAFQGVEDNLAALRILEEEARVQDEAVTAAQESLRLITTQYVAGIVSYLNVITAQTAALSNEVTAIQIRGRRMAAAVLLVQALGGGWNAAELPTVRQVTERERHP
jgi:NodT family efflux transporter outer membrane factor (OMF) lipoprotein